MPKSTNSKRVQDESAVSTIEPDEDDETTLDEDEDEDVTDEVEDEEEDEDEATLGFSFESRPAPKDFTPDRKTPGRVRQPSYFDDILRREDVYGKGWQMVPVTSKEHIKAVLRELNRAKLHLNKTAEEGEPEIGLDLDVREDAVYYKSRLAQKRERKNGTNGAGPTAEDESSEEVFTEEDDVEFASEEA